MNHKHKHKQNGIQPHNNQLQVKFNPGLRQRSPDIQLDMQCNRRQRLGKVRQFLPVVRGRGPSDVEGQDAVFVGVGI